MDRTPKVLLVDDEPFMIRAVAAALESEGFEVIVCEQWTSIANTVRSQTPDLVLLDYNMPLLKGDSICSILKRNGSGAEMKIVLFSSEPPASLSRIADECGADGFIPKNAPASDLIRSVRLMMSTPPAACV